MFSPAQKKKISPFVAVTYATVALSGILMLLHVNSPTVHHIHQWAGLLFLIGGTTHMIMNWRMLSSYFKNRKVVYGALTGVLAIVLLASFFPLKGNGEGHGRGRGQFTYKNHY